MMKNFDDVLQFDNIDEYFNYCINEYVDLFKNEIDVNIIKMFCNLHDYLNEHYKNNLQYIFIFDDTIDILTNDNVAYTFNFDENDFYYYEKTQYEDYEDYCLLNLINIGCLNMGINETKIFNCVCDNALLKINDIEFNIIYDCDEYEMLIKKNNYEFYSVDVNFCDCEFINNYATKIKLTRIS